jgi:hypothetical protein
MSWQIWMNFELYKRIEGVRREEMQREAELWRLLYPRKWLEKSRTQMRSPRATTERTTVLPSLRHT